MTRRARFDVIAVLFAMAALALPAKAQDEPAPPPPAGDEGAGPGAAEREKARAAQAEKRAEQMLEQIEKQAERGRNLEKVEEQLERFTEQFASTDFHRDNQDRILALQGRLRTANWPGRSAYNGEASLPAEGFVRIFYPFDRTAELGDFVAAKSGAKPKVGDGHLQGGRRDGVIRHKLEARVDDPFSIELTARGYGKLLVVLAGDGDDAPADGPAVELDSSARSLKMTLERGKDRKPLEVEQARGDGFDAESAWAVRLERFEGGVRAVAVAADGTKTPLEAKADELPAPEGDRLRIGLAFRAGEVRVDELVLEAPLPEHLEQGGPQAEIPTGRWVPLGERGLDDFEVQGDWDEARGVITQQSGQGILVPKLTKGRLLESYTFSVEVMTRGNAARRRRAKDVYFVITLPFDGSVVSWTFTEQQQQLDGTGKRFLERLVENQWHELSVKVSPKGLQASVNGKPAFAVTAAEIGSARRDFKQEGLAFVAPRQGGEERVLIRKPRIKLER